MCHEALIVLYTAIYWHPISFSINVMQFQGESNMKYHLNEIISVVNLISYAKIWGFHGGDYEEWCLLGCYAMWLL
jgi:hypothetical protein